MANCDESCAENSSWKRTVTRLHHHGGHHPGAHGDDDRHGARQPERFNPARAALLDDRSRFEYLPPDEIFNMLTAPAGGRVVDFGAGTGTYAVELARSRPDLEVIALDEQQEMLICCVRSLRHESSQISAQFIPMKSRAQWNGRSRPRAQRPARGWR